MKNDIKKKFIDILFEPEEDEEEIFEKPKTAEKPARKQENTVKAKDILYRKSEGSAFINLEEKKKPEEKKVEDDHVDYEFSSQISPIFGLIKENKPDISSVSSGSANESLLSKPDSSHLEIITSPFYGYGSREDYEKEHPDLFGELPLSEEDELHRLLDGDDDGYGYSEHTYDDFEEDYDNGKIEEISLFHSLDEED